VTGDTSHEADLGVALGLADAADRITMSRFRASDLRVDSKPDLTPVSDADRTVEAAFRKFLTTQRPDDAVLGEEYGESATVSTRRWIVDPIDGTKNFVRGNPVWATLLALEVDGEVVVGVVSAPALARRWWAVRGGGAWTRDVDGHERRCAVSKVASTDDAFLSYSSLGGWGDREPGFRRLRESVWRTRGFGDFWSYTMVAEGSVDIATEPEVSLWDLAAVCLLVEEAGGRFTDLTGRAGPAGGSALASNGALHEPALALLGAR
jgi:histidinol-phosphatase